MVRTAHFHCWGSGFSPSLRNWDPTSCVPWPKWINTWNLKNEKLSGYILSLLSGKLPGPGINVLWIISGCWELPNLLFTQPSLVLAVAQYLRAQSLQVDMGLNPSFTKLWSQASQWIALSLSFLSFERGIISISKEIVSQEPFYHSARHFDLPHSLSLVKS